MAKGYFSKRDLFYIAADDEYQGPAFERLNWRFKTEENGRTIHKYWSFSTRSRHQAPTEHSDRSDDLF